MKVLIVADSFKGSLTSEQVCTAISEGLQEANKNIEIITLPFADGGEGFSSCLAKICKAKPLYIESTDLYGNDIDCTIFAGGDTAIIECAEASGLQAKKEVMNATSYGTGTLIKHALNQGFSNIILGLGGSGCNDGGAGALAALGAVFKDISEGIIETPTGSDLEKIYSADFNNIVKGLHFIYACDVTNEFFGTNGAAYIFAPQKGASEQEVIHLDNGLKNLNSLLPVDVSEVTGAGAAGGLCGGLYSVFGGEIKSGFEVLREACCLDEKIKWADVVITGEGKTDRQTLMGKLPYRISTMASEQGRKCIVISGSFDDVTIGDMMISLVDETTTLEKALSNPFNTLKDKSKILLQ